MKTVVVLLGLVVFISAQPPKPKLPDVFEARTFIEIRVHHNDENITLRSEGWWAVDETDGKALEEFRFDDSSEHDIHYLQRYDLGAVFEVDGRDECKRHGVNGTIPPVWGWMSEATYQGREHFGADECDAWSATIGYAEMTVCVDLHNPRPVYVIRKSEQREVLLFFRYFVVRTPNQGLFYVPHFCPSNFTAPATGLATCVDRKTMISRAQVWVDNHVPYNQGGYYQGYREDCSGFVSMAWELKSSLTTETLPTVSHSIAKADLQPGDVLLDKAEHVVIFGGWTKQGTEYMAYEETRPGEGTVKRPTPYPYWYNQAAFIPYRFNSVC